jgi:hypothetical protein
MLTYSDRWKRRGRAHVAQSIARRLRNKTEIHLSPYQRWLFSTKTINVPKRAKRLGDLKRHLMSADPSLTVEVEYEMSGATGQYKSIVVRRLMEH